MVHRILCSSVEPNLTQKDTNGEINPLNAISNPIFLLLVLLGARHIFHVGTIIVKDINLFTLRIKRGLHCVEF